METVALAAVCFAVTRVGRGLAPAAGRVDSLAVTAFAAGGILLAAVVLAGRRNAAEEARTAGLLRSVVMETADAIFAKDLAGRYLMVNRAAADMMGLPEAAIPGMTDVDIFPPDVSAALLGADRAVLMSGESKTLEERAGAPGARRTFLTTRRPLKDRRGRVAGVMGIARDITEHKNAQERLRESEEKFRSLVESAPDYITLLARDGTFLFANRFADGYEADSVLGTKLYEYLPGEERERVRATIDEVFRTGRTATYETRGVGDGGALAWYRCAVGPVQKDGRVESVMVISNDISDRVFMEQRLRQSEEKFRSFVENAPDHITVVDGDGRIEFMNRAGAPARSAPPPGESVFAFIHAEDQSSFREALDRAFRSGKAGTLETRWAVDGGPPRWHRCRLGPLEEEGRIRAALVIASDIHESRQAQEAERRARERLRHLSRRLIEAQESERRHLARELHDEIGQALTAVKMSLQAAAQRLDPEDGALVLDGTAIVDQALERVRGLSVALRPSLLDDLGLVPALRWYLDQKAARAGFAFRFEADPDVLAPPDVETACFRIAQEALTNIARHSGARSVNLAVKRRRGELRLTVADDGRGFAVQEALERTGTDASLGLVGMRERARLLGGRVTVRSVPQKGTVVRAVFPLFTAP